MAEDNGETRDKLEENSSSGAGPDPSAAGERSAGLDSSANQDQSPEPGSVPAPSQSSPAKPQQESLNYTRPDGVSVTVPIIRAGMPDLFVALQPPKAEPYVMAPREADPRVVVDFFSKHVRQVEELRADMLKRYAKSPSLKCRYQTGDVAFVMGRPFQLRVYPLGQQKDRLKSGARGRATSKYSVNPDISLLSLYVVHPKNYDEAKLAFNGYAETVLMNNARNLSADFGSFLFPEKPVPPVRMRAMRERWSSDEAGAIWLSTDLIPYPPDCLVYVLWSELAKRSERPQEEIEKRFAEILPGKDQARKMLAERPEPYSLQ